MVRHKKNETVPLTFSIQQIQEINYFRLQNSSLLVGTQLHTMLSMFKAILQVMFCKAVEELRHFCFHIFYRHKMGSFEH